MKVAGLVLLCSARLHGSLCEEQIGKVKDCRDRQDKKLSDQNDKSQAGGLKRYLW